MGSGDPRGRGSKVARGAAAMASLFVLFGAFSAGAWTEDLSRRWRTVQSQQFEVSDPEPLTLGARRVLRVVEWGHERRRPLLGPEPRKRVPIVVNDEVDTSNGNGAQRRHASAVFVQRHASAPLRLPIRRARARRIAIVRTPQQRQPAAVVRPSRSWAKVLAYTSRMSVSFLLTISSTLLVPLLTTSSSSLRARSASSSPTSPSFCRLSMMSFAS